MCNDGTLWLNIGDSYQSTRIYLKDQIDSGKELINLHMKDYQKYPDKRANFKGGEYKIKRKDMFGIPWRVAFALQEYGWFLRSDIIWSKTNPMPENVHDRPSKSHEYIFLFSKKQHYYFDEDMIREKSGAKCRTVWSHAVDSSGLGHYAAFPEQLINKCVIAGSPENGIILDPFFGSGTTGSVCLKNNRNFIGIEINPDFAFIAQNRLGPMLKQTRLKT